MADEDELDDIRRRKLQELQDQAEAQQGQADQEAAVEAKRQAILRQILTHDARERLGRLRVGYPDFAQKVEDQLIYLSQSGRLQGRTIDDDTLKEILERLTPEKRDIDIKRL